MECVIVRVGSQGLLASTKNVKRLAVGMGCVLRAYVSVTLVIWGAAVMNVGC
jgi:hypothetical protein